MPSAWARLLSLVIALSRRAFVDRTCLDLLDNKTSLKGRCNGLFREVAALRQRVAAVLPSETKMVHILVVGQAISLKWVSARAMKRGMDQVDRGEFEQAIANFGYNDFSLDNEVASFERGRAYWHLGRFQDAVGDLLKNSPKQPDRSGVAFSHLLLPWGLLSALATMTWPSSIWVSPFVG